MNKKSLREFTHVASNFLNLNDSTYKQWVFRYTFLELEKDLFSKGDITTNALIGQGKFCSANIIAKDDGIMAGAEEIKYFLVDADKNFRPSVRGDFQVEFLVDDGSKFSKGDVIVKLSGEAWDILAVERVILNFLARLISVATNTAKFVKLVEGFDVLIAPTRKTLWGLLDKKAVFLGGGGTHRLNLSDAILVKDNHLNLMGRDFGLVLGKISTMNDIGRFIEVEVENGEEAISVAKIFNNTSFSSVGVVMFDNMSPSDIVESLNQIKKLGLYDDVLFEASGGINANNLVEYAETGVDIISIGALTSGGVSNVDLSMEVL